METLTEPEKNLTTVARGIPIALNTVRKGRFPWMRVAIFVWICGYIGLSGRFLHSPDKSTALTTYLTGGTHWGAGSTVYTYWMGFVYSPLIAGFFSWFCKLPLIPSYLLWFAINEVVFLLGVHSFVMKGPFQWKDKSKLAKLYLLLFPQTLGNLHNAQASPIVISTILVGISAAYNERWMVSALMIALATHFKIYPVAVGLLLCILYPRQFIWRLLVALVALTGVSFLFQSPGYVLEQYGEWIQTRLVDNRLTYPMEHAPLDLYFMLVRFGHLPVSQMAYHGIQVAGGGLIALLCMYAKVQQWSRERILCGMFALVSVWMTLLGPATENLTYILLAPVSCVVFLEVWQSVPRWVRFASVISMTLLMMAEIRPTVASKWHPYSVRLWQPMGALFFIPCALGWMMSDRFGVFAGRTRVLQRQRYRSEVSERVVASV